MVEIQELEPWDPWLFLLVIGLSTLYWTVTGTLTFVKDKIKLGWNKLRRKE